MENRFSIEEQYKAYLKRIALKEENMHPFQKVQLKQTFFGAWGQLLVLLHEDLSDLNEEDAIRGLASMTEQVADFFDGEAFKNREN